MASKRPESPENMMKTFRVWVWPFDYEYLVCVDGMENARWFVDRLARSFVFRSARPINQEQNSSLCTFQVPCNSLLPFSKIKELLTDIPEVTLLKVAAASSRLRRYGGKR
jgi:hypothetical protein